MLEYFILGWNHLYPKRGSFTNARSLKCSIWMFVCGKDHNLDSLPLFGGCEMWIPHSCVNVKNLIFSFCIWTYKLFTDTLTKILEDWFYSLLRARILSFSQVNLKSGGNWLRQTLETFFKCIDTGNISLCTFLHWPVWICKCFFRSDGYLKLLLHCSHTLGPSLNFLFPVGFLTVMGSVVNENHWALLLFM